jgi:N-acetylmuramoyl-L-alanine amidase
MRKVVSMMLFMSVFFSMFAAIGQAAEVVPKLYLNGQLLKSDVNPQIINQFTVVPVRTISEGLGYQIEWDNATKTVTVNSGTDVIQLILNDSVAKVNDQLVQMDTAASIVKGTTLVPLRFIGEQFGLKFEWKATEKEIHMFEQPKEPTGWITEVSFDGVSSLTVNYDGIVKANKPIYLDDPKRIVFDFPDTSYSANLSSQFLNGQVETPVTENPLLQTYRYSLFTNAPSVARLVLLVSDDTGFVMTENAGEIRLDLMPASEIPVDPDAPVEEPEPVTPPVTEPADDGIFEIVIDAGHGGKDPGATSVLKTTEKQFNLSVALKIKALLDKETKLKGHLTRSDDTFIELIDRAKFANELKADLFISIHSNAIDKPSVSGTETYYSRAESKPFADIMHKHMLVGTGLKDRGVKQANYKVIKETTMPAILLEAGYLTNATDSKALFSEAVQNRIASEVVKGIKEYLKLE